MAAVRDQGGKRGDSDPAKAVVIAYIEGLVRGGWAKRSVVDDGVIELTLASGEVFHLGATSVTRVI